MAVITICRSFATGGERFGRALASHLNYDYMDRKLVREVAYRTAVSEDSVESQEDGQTRGLMNFLAKIIDKDFIMKITGHSQNAGYLDSEVYLKILREIVAGLAEKDNVVIVGRGSHCILQGYPGAYFIRVVAEWEDRVKNARAQLGTNVGNINRFIRDRDLKAKKFMDHFYNTDGLDVSLFHLVINLSKVSIAQAVQQVATLISKESMMTMLRDRGGDIR